MRCDDAEQDNSTSNHRTPAFNSLACEERDVGNASGTALLPLPPCKPCRLFHEVTCGQPVIVAAMLKPTHIACRPQYDLPSLLAAVSCQRQLAVLPSPVSPLTRCVRPRARTALFPPTRDQGTILANGTASQQRRREPAAKGPKPLSLHHPLSPHHRGGRGRRQRRRRHRRRDRGVDYCVEAFHQLRAEHGEQDVQADAPRYQLPGPPSS